MEAAGGMISFSLLCVSFPVKSGAKSAAGIRDRFFRSCGGGLRFGSRLVCCRIVNGSDVKLCVRNDIGAKRPCLTRPSGDFALVLAVGEAARHIRQITVGIKLINIARRGVRRLIVIVIPRNTKRQPSAGG